MSILWCLLIVTLISQHCSTGPSDITTIYRFDDEDANNNDNNNNWYPLEIPGKLYVRDATGWIKTNNAKLGISFPNEEYRIFEIEDNNMTDVLPLDWTKTFAVSTKQTLPDSFVYLLTDEKPDVADLLVFKITSTLISVLSCKYATPGQSFVLPGLGIRSCLPVIRSKEVQVPELITFSFERQGDSISVEVTSSTELIDNIDNIPLEHFTNLEYISMGAGQNPAKFIFRKPKQIWALAASRGQLNPEVSARLNCLILNYFIDGHSGEYIEVHVNERMFQTPSIHKSQASWITHRFVFTSPIYEPRIKIVGHKNSSAHVLIESIRSCDEHDAWDYSTFENPGSVDVHARASALGLPFVLPNGTINGPNVDIDTPACPDANRSCAWALNNWAPSYTTDKVAKSAPLSIWHETTEKWTTTERIIKKLYHFSTSVKMTFSLQNLRTNDAQLRLYLSYDEDISKPNVMIIKIQEHKISVYNIIIDYDTRICWVPGQKDVYCKELHAEHSGSIEWVLYATYELSVEHTQEYLQVTIKGNDLESSCFVKFNQGTYNRKNFISMTTDDMIVSNGLINLQGNLMLELNSVVGRLTSPPIIPSMSEICVSLFYYISSGSHASLRLEFLDGNTTELEELNETQGWQHKRIVKSHGRSNSPLQLVLEGIKDDDNGRVLVQRIGGCHPEEDVLYLGHEDSLHVMKTGIQTAVMDKTEVLTPSDLCVNGGLRSHQGACDCPPGFMGETCEKGCGPDRYGSDCGSRCSWSSRGCKAMYLCHTSLGCSCASGYTGFFCSQSCTPGTYGADCRKTCGHCAQKVINVWQEARSTCDVFTGICHDGCMDGYHPPLCEEKTSYFATPPKVTRGAYLTIKLDFAQRNIKGKGTPMYFLLQYKKNQSSAWVTFNSGELHVTSWPSSNIIYIDEPVTDSSYHIRSVIINHDGSSYQEDDIPSTELKTNCPVPQSMEYELKASDIEQSSFVMSWKPPSEEWCKVSHFEVFIKEGWKWSLIAKVEGSNVKISRRSPGEVYPVQVRAVTTLNNYMPFSNPITVTTKGLAHPMVQNLKVTSADSKQFMLQWEYPQFPPGSAGHYIITYQCVKLLGCLDNSCAHSQGQFKSYDKTATLDDLLPHAQYFISVTVFSGIEGPATSIQSVTLPSGSQAIAGSVPEPVSDLTNTSFTVHWTAPDNCSRINGFFKRYWYRLKDEEKEGFTVEGSTLQPMANFTDLTPLTSYKVEVFVMTNGGWDKNYPLIIPVTTRATSPEQVRNFTVYKASRRMVGLRWKEPSHTYGALKSFKVSYAEKAESKKTITREFNLTRCSAWPDLYCATIMKLRPDTEYTFAIQARNVEVADDGEPVSITAKTLEGPPDPPSYIQLVNQDPTSLSIRWGIPNLLNGVLRSFLVSVQEVDSFNSSDCCLYLPLEEVTVHTEEPSYHVEVAGLRPASTYTIGIQGKTTAIGGAISMMAHTAPPLPELPTKPQVTINGEAEEITVLMTPITENQEFVKGYLLLRVSEKDTYEATIWDKVLETKLKGAINQMFSIVGEFSQEELMRDKPVILQQGEIASEEGILGEISAPALQINTPYRLLLVVILEYEGTYSVSYKQSTPFSILW